MARRTDAGSLGAVDDRRRAGAATARRSNRSFDTDHAAAAPARYDTDSTGKDRRTAEATLDAEAPADQHLLGRDLTGADTARARLRDTCASSRGDERLLRQSPVATSDSPRLRPLLNGTTRTALVVVDDLVANLSPA